jgi:putative nucleotidyltransferase with HDIG domain
VASTPDLQLLLADDDTAIRELLSRGLRHDFRVLVARDGKEALEALQQTRPDAILVDEMMPGATGTEVLRAARELMPEVPRLLMTASQDPSAAMRAVNHGEIHRFYTKPLKVMEVKRAIRELVTRARAEEALRAELFALRTSQASTSSTATVVGLLCEGPAGDRIEQAAHRRSFVVRRATRVETFEAVVGAGGIDVVVIDAAVGATVLSDIAQLARRVEVGTSLILVEREEGHLETCALAFQLGAVDCFVAPLPDELLLSVRLERAAGRPRERAELRRVTWDLVTTNRELALANRRVEEGQVKLLGGLVRALEARDPYTAGHTDRVAEISVRCAEAFGLSTARREVVRVGALLHDIGKIGIRDEVLYKPGKLTPEEFEVIKTHTTIGARILEPRLRRAHRARAPRASRRPRLPRRSRPLDAAARGPHRLRRRRPRRHHVHTTVPEGQQRRRGLRHPRHPRRRPARRRGRGGAAGAARGRSPRRAAGARALTQAAVVGSLSGNRRRRCRFG